MTEKRSLIEPSSRSDYYGFCVVVVGILLFYFFA